MHHFDLKNGALHAEDVSLEVIADEVGTPAYVYSSATLKRHYGLLRAAADAHRLPPLDRQVRAGETFTACGEDVHVIDVPGHTVGHVAFHMPRAALVFTADSLMAIGCGRLLEGTADQMWTSLSALNALPGETVVCSGHDYCKGNGAFALSVDPGNAALRQRLDDTAAGRRPCSPSTLDDERQTNPFLRAPVLAASLGMDGAPDAEVFARLRKMKDEFRG